MAAMFFFFFFFTLSDFSSYFQLGRDKEGKSGKGGKKNGWKGKGEWREGWGIDRRVLKGIEEGKIIDLLAISDTT